MAPVAEAFVRMRPDWDQFGPEVASGIRSEARRVGPAGRSLGDAISDGLRDGVMAGLRDTSEEAQDRLRRERPGFTREGNRLGDAASDGFRRGFNTHTSRLGSDFRRTGMGLGRSLGTGIVAGIALLGGGALLKGFIDEAREAGKVSRITANAIKVTGGAANVTERQVSSLAQAISNKTAIDDEQVQASANLLLTFKQVANQTGENNRIFDRAVKASADMSVQFGSTESTAKMLGKALNDPVAGVTALSRAGVTFTQQQKDQIKTLVESNRTLDAQKIILAEVESQVGGAAAAAADPMQRLGVVMNNVKETIGVALLPVVNDLSDWLADEGPSAGRAFAGWLREDAIPAVRDFAGWIKGDLWPALKDLGGDVWAGLSEGFGNFMDAIHQDRGDLTGRGTIGGLGDLITNVILPALGTMAREGIPAVGTAIGELTVAIATTGEAAIDAAIAGLEAWEALEDGVVDSINTIFEGLDFLSGFVKGPFGNRLRGSIDDWKDWRNANQHELDDTLEHLRSLQAKLHGITTEHAKQEFRSLSQVANDELDKIKDEDVNVRFQLFAERFGGKPLPGLSGGAGHGAVARAFSQHKWTDPYGGIGGPTLSVRERKVGQSAVARQFRQAREAAEAAGAGIGGRAIVNPYRITATWGSYPGHTGIDLAGPIGSPVHAIGGGRVARAVSLTDSYGKHVIVDHPQGWSTLYAHMSALGVSAGQAVGGGSVVGLRGSTGNSSGPHTHFEVRRNGTPINPQSVLSFDTGRGTLSPGWNLAYNGTGGPETLNRNGATSGGKVDAIINVRVGDQVRHVDLDALTRTARRAARETMTFSERLIAQLQKQADKAAATTERLAERARNRAESARSVLDELRSTAATAFSGAQSAVLGIVDPAALASDPAGHLATWANDARRFVGALGAMAAKGLPPSLVAQVAGLGPTVGYDVATAFASLDAGGTASANASLAAITGYASQAGEIVANLTVPPSMIEAQAKTVAGLDAAVKAIEREGAKTQRQLDRAIEALGTDRVAVLERKGGEVIFRIVQDEEKKAARRK